MQEISAIILAAGKGTRMNSPLPKVLHPVAGLPMISYVLSAIRSLEPKECRVVVGHAKNLVQSVVEPLGASCYVQEKQLGTGHAVQMAQPSSMQGHILIVNGDHPLLQAADLQSFVEQFEKQEADVAVLSAEMEEPGAFGRIIRHNGDFRAIVEARHAGKETLEIKEVNTGIYLIRSGLLEDLTSAIEMNAEKEEFYLTDIVDIANEKDYKVLAIPAKNPRVAFGVNTQEELAQASKSIFQAKVKTLMQEGVVVIDPESTYVEPTVRIGPGSVLYPGTFIKGLTTIGHSCVLEPNVFIKNTDIADACQIRAGSYLEDCSISEKAMIGPYARLRPETKIGKDAKVGNFVEMKKVNFGEGSKASHLTYLGDADIGKNVNVGCGTITCNYAANRKKYKTIIKDGVFVGSDTQFVAPVTIGEDAVIGSGSTITKDVPDRALAVARGKQFIKEDYIAKDEDECAES